MNVFQYNTMRLTNAPPYEQAGLRDTWDTLYEAFGGVTFHPIEGQGVLKAKFKDISRQELGVNINKLVAGGFATAP